MQSLLYKTRFKIAHLNAYKNEISNEIFPNQKRTHLSLTKGNPYSVIKLMKAEAPLPSHSGVKNCQLIKIKENHREITKRWRHDCSVFMAGTALFARELIAPDITARSASTNWSATAVIILNIASFVPD
ncbi:hypothetical protein J6590_018100 [Homalodisca vitripennis]|nr:hypothetical protein J6590_018100 [Homalodisca vitripennis]